MANPVLSVVNKAFVNASGDFGELSIERFCNTQTFLKEFGVNEYASPVCKFYKDIGF